MCSAGFVAIDLPPNGPQFWEDNYGFTSFSEFSDAAREILDRIPLPYGGIVKPAWTLEAWLSPFSGVGPFLQATTSARQLDPPSKAAANLLLQPFAQGLIQSSEESQMAGLLIPNCYQVNINAVSGTQPVCNVVGVENGAGNAAAAVAAVQTAWKVASGPMSRLSSLYVLESFRAVDISDPNGDIAVLSDTTAGSLAATPLATNAACALVSWNGGTRSKSSRGRLYYGPLGDSQVASDGRSVDPTNRTQIATAFTNFRASLASSGYPLVVLSRSLSQSFPVTSHTVQTIIATQRRRIRA